MANVTGVSKKQNGLKKSLQVDGSCLGFMFIESNVEKHGCTMSVFFHTGITILIQEIFQKQKHKFMSMLQPWPTTRCIKSS